MLVRLSVHNYAIVEHLDLELDRGMSVITGETGAGKSIMLDALGLTLGDRADSGVVRPGADKADILATFDLQDIPEARREPGFAGAAWRAGSAGQRGQRGVEGRAGTHRRRQLVQVRLVVAADVDRLALHRIQLADDLRFVVGQ